MNGERKIWTSLGSAQMQSRNSIIVPNSCNNISIQWPLKTHPWHCRHFTLWHTVDYIMGHCGFNYAVLRQQRRWYQWCQLWCWISMFIWLVASKANVLDTSVIKHNSNPQHKQINVKNSEDTYLEIIYTNFQLTRQFGIYFQILVARSA